MNTDMGQTAAGVGRTSKMGGKPKFNRTTSGGQISEGDRNSQGGSLGEV